jgi:hypothetical protein
MANYRLFLSLLLFLICSTAASAQKINFSHKPYMGPVSGQGDALLVDLHELAKAFGMEVRESEGGWVVGKPPDAAQPKPGEALLNGQSLATVAGEIGPLVNLKDFAEAAGLTYNYDKPLETIDVGMGSKASGKAKAPASPLEFVPGKAIYINQKTPGVLVDLDSLVVRGKYTLLLWYKDDNKDPGYRSCQYKIDAFLKYDDVAVVKVNTGDHTTPLSQEYPGMVPRLEVYVPNGKKISIYNGHSMLPLCADPVGSLQEWKKRAPQFR